MLGKEGVNSKSLLFHGAPDIIIHKKKDTRKEGIVVSYNYKEEVNEDSSPNSQDSGRFQMGHQMNECPYTAGSFLSNKAGELVAALHTMLVCRALQRYSKGKTINSLTAHGLHIHRAVVK